MKNGGENDQSASVVYKGQCFWYLQTKRHCLTQTNPEINGDFKGKECICSVQLAGIFTTHFTYSIFLSAATELMHTGPRRALEMCMPQIWKECGAAHNATASSCRAISDQACYFYILNDKFKKRSKMANIPANITFLKKPLTLLASVFYFSFWKAHTCPKRKTTAKQLHLQCTYS